MVGAGKGAAAETITTIGGHRAAAHHAFVGLSCGAVLEVGIVKAAVFGPRAHVRGIALQLPLTAVVTHSRISIEEAILFASIDVVTGDPGAERGLVVVEGADTLRILEIHLAIPVVVDPIGTLGDAEFTTD